MFLQLLNSGITPGQLRLGKYTVNLAVADDVKNRNRPMLAAFQFRNQMVPTLCIRWNRPSTQRTDFPILFILHMRNRNTMASGRLPGTKNFALQTFGDQGAKTVIFRSDSLGNILDLELIGWFHVPTAGVAEKLGDQMFGEIVFP